MMVYMYSAMGPIHYAPNFFLTVNCCIVLVSCNRRAEHGRLIKHDFGDVPRPPFIVFSLQYLHNYNEYVKGLDYSRGW